MDSLSDRIRRRLAATGKSARRASLEAGLSASFVHNVLAGKARSPSAENVARLAAVLGTRERWLLRREGPEEEPSPEATALAPYAPQARVGAPEWPAREYRRLHADMAGRRRPSLAAAGEWQIPLAYLRDEVGAAASDLAFLEVVDEAMAPTLMPGDRVLVDFSQKGPAAGVFLIHDGSEAVLRRLEVVIGSDPLRIRITADNPRQAEYEVPRSSLPIFGRAVWRGTRL